MRAVVTVSGTDRRGIIAKVSSFLADQNINIEDISQTIMGDKFVMMMIVDTSECTKDFAELTRECEEMGRGIGMSVRLQHEDIFNVMHNV